MNKYNPKIHHRRSIRLKGYDYSQAGLYFATIITQNREHLFGKIANGKIELNDAGEMINKWYNELENKFPDIKCDAMVIMPNHFHCIIKNVGNVGADLRVCPNENKNKNNNNDNHAQTHTINPTKQNVRNALVERGKLGVYNTLDEYENLDVDNSLGEHGKYNALGEHGKYNASGEHDKYNTLGEHVGSPLHRVMQWFKTMTTNEYIRGVKNKNWKRFDGKLWQRNYWEHIIKNEKSYIKISNYILNNPQKWDDDSLNNVKWNK